MFDIEGILRQGVISGASDVHLKVGEAPIFRKHSAIKRTNLPALTQEDMDAIVQKLIPENMKSKIANIFDFDFSYEIPGLSRFRVNFCRDLGRISFVIRIIPFAVPTCRELNLPPSIENFTKINNGIVLVTGPTGSGKTTTIASLLDHINTNYQKHIVTLEDPVEFIYTNKKSLFTQRQLGIDTASFPDGVKYALRQDPDIILIGEMRDRETIMSALKAAETGHLVFSTLHTTDAVQTVNRIINAFEPYEREPLKQQLAATLRGTIAQKLVRKADGQGRVPAAEILVVTPAVQNYIIKDELSGVYDLIKAGKFNDMITMNMSLYRLVKTGLVTKEEAIKASDSPNELEQMIKGAFHGSGEIAAY